MATVKPFPGVRFSQKELSDLICPPYDVISPDQKKGLLKRSRCNIVQIELPEGAGKRNKYQEAGRLFRDWQEKGILATDSEPAFYFYEQVFKDRGVKKSRRGFFAALKLANPQKGEVKPHEKTLAKPKEDRLKLLRSVRANISPVFGLFNDDKGKLVAMARAVAAARPLAQGRDADGMNRLWRVDDPKQVALVRKVLSTRNIFIADGHHRYETAWNYSQERGKKAAKRSPEAEYNYVLVFLCPMEDPGLVIWPTHRVLQTPADIEERISTYFNVLPASAYAKLSKKLPQPLLVYIGGKSRTLVLKNKATLKQAMPDKCKAYQELAVSILHSVLLSGVAPDTITYVKSETEAFRLARERKHMAVLVPATPMAAIKAIALAGQTMPQKSTYFYPKLATGMVIHSLE